MACCLGLAQSAASRGGPGPTSCSVTATSLETEDGSSGPAEATSTATSVTLAALRRITWAISTISAQGCALPETPATRATCRASSRTSVMWCRRGRRPSRSSTSSPSASTTLAPLRIDTRLLSRSSAQPSRPPRGTAVNQRYTRCGLPALAPLPRGTPSTRLTSHPLSPSPSATIRTRRPLGPPCPT